MGMMPPSATDSANNLVLAPSRWLLSDESARCKRYMVIVFVHLHTHNEYSRLEKMLRLHRVKYGDQHGSVSEEGREIHD